MMRPKNNDLTDRQYRFVSEYLKDCNGKQAAIRAGYAAGSAEVSASRLLSQDKVRKIVDEHQAKLREKDKQAAESISDKIRRRLWEEADDFSEFASHSARIRALELLGKIYGEFIIDNKQKTDALSDILAGLNGKVMGVTRDDPLNASDDDESY